MRRNLGLVLIGIGAFFLALAPLMRFYVARQVAVAPANLFQKTTLQASNALYLDAAQLKIRRNANLTAINTVRGDVHASTGNIVVWDSFTSVDDPATKKNVEILQQRAAFDRRTGALTNSHGASVGNDTSVKQHGIGLFWPIGVKKKTYQYFDISTKRAWPIAYDGEERIHGLKAYRFVQHIPETVTDAINGVPVSLLGVTDPKQIPGYDAKTAGVPVDRVYEATVTLWVDPRTGVQVGQDEKVTQRLRTRDGVDRTVVGDLDLKMTDASQRHLVDLANSSALKIAAVRTVGPLVAAVVGLLLFAVGLALGASARRSRVSDPAPAGQPVGAAGAPAPRSQQDD